MSWDFLSPSPFVYSFTLQGLSKEYCRHLEPLPPALPAWFIEAPYLLQVGTSSWMRYLKKLIPEKILNGLNWRGLNWHSEVPKYFPFSMEYQNVSLDNYFALNRFCVFSFVRHPFDRLVSAYLNKIVTLKFKDLKSERRLIIKRNSSAML